MPSRLLLLLVLLVVACGPAVSASGPTLDKHTPTPLPRMEGVELTGVFRDMKEDQSGGGVWKVQLCGAPDRKECFYVLAVEVQNPKRPRMCVATPILSEVEGPLVDRPDLFRVFCYK